MAEILVVEDELATRKMLRFILEQQGGHSVREAASAEEAEGLVAGGAAEIVISDVMLSGADGITFCRRLRARSNVPILLVSARSDVASRVRGLQSGADDYLSKPFDATELIARVEALLRRARLQPRADTAGLLRVGDLLLDLTQHQVEVRAPRSPVRRVQLTAAEFKLLVVLARSPGRTFTRRELEDGLWGSPGSPAVVGPNTLTAAVSDLRERLEVDPRNPRYIHTVRSIGYRLDP